MTNREWLNTLSDEDFSKWLWIVDVECNVNPLVPKRADITRECLLNKTALTDWLKEEYKGVIEDE